MVFFENIKNFIEQKKRQRGDYPEPEEQTVGDRLKAFSASVFGNREKAESYGAVFPEEKLGPTLRRSYASFQQEQARRRREEPVLRGITNFFSPPKPSELISKNPEMFGGVSDDEEVKRRLANLYADSGYFTATAESIDLENDEAFAYDPIDFVSMGTTKISKELVNKISKEIADIADEKPIREILKRNFDNLTDEMVDKFSQVFKSKNNPEEIAENLTSMAKLKRMSFPQTMARDPQYEDLSRAVNDLYTPETNKAAVERANRFINEKGLEEATLDLLSDPKTKFSDPDGVVSGHLVIKQLEKAGKMESAVRVAEELSSVLKRNGQAIQAAAVFNRLSPEGVLRYASRNLADSISNKEIKKLTEQENILRREVDDISKKLTDQLKKESTANQAEDVLSSRKSQLIQENPDVFQEESKKLRVVDDELRSVRAQKNNIKQTLKAEEAKIATREKKIAQYQKELPGLIENSEEVQRLFKKADDALNKLRDQRNNLRKRERSLIDKISSRERSLIKTRQSILDRVSDYRQLAPEARKKLIKLDNDLAVAKDMAKQVGSRVSALRKKIKVANESLERTISRMTKHMTKKEAQALVDQAKKIEKLPQNSRERIIESAVLQKMVHDLVPSTWKQKASLFQTMMQLLNPKTLIRNIIGNSVFSVTEEVTQNIFIAPIDWATTKVRRMFGIPARRTVMARSRSDYAKIARGSVEGFRQGYKEAIMQIDTVNANTQFDIPIRAVFKGGALKKAEQTLGVALRGPDRAFYQAAFDGEVASQLKAFGVDSIDDLSKSEVKQILDRAHYVGLYRTFQDPNTLVNLFSGLKKLLNGGSDFGMGDFVLKYPKTPANLLNRGIAYSPFGFVRTVFTMAEPLFGKTFDQRAFVDSFGKAIAGSSVWYAGMMLNRLGIVSGKFEQDRDIRETQRQAGLGSYKINVSALRRFVASGFSADKEIVGLQEDDTLISYDWLQPTAISFALGVNFDENDGSENSVIGRAAVIAEAAESGINTLAEQPLISGFASMFEYGVYEGLESTLANVPASFTPTLLNQVNQLIDNTRRDSFSQNPIERAKLNFMRRVPGLAQQVPVRYETLGEEGEVYAFGKNNIWNVFFNPAFVTKYKPSEEEKMVLDMFNETGESIQAPRVAPYTTVVNGERIQLTPNQRSAFQQYSGLVTRNEFLKLTKSTEFKRASQDEQAEMLRSLLTDVSTASRIIILGHRPEKKRNGDFKVSGSKRVNRFIDEFKRKEGYLYPYFENDW